MQITEDQMPSPDTLVLCKDGTSVAAMFYFAAAEQRLDQIAEEQGFECSSLLMEDEVDDDDQLLRRCFEGDETALNKWNPITPDGWTFAAKFDTEDGPMAVFIRRKTT